MAEPVTDTTMYDAALSVLAERGYAGATTRRIAEAAGIVPVSADALGWNGDAVEAEAFAYLAVRALDGLPLSFPGTTGVPRPTGGGRVHQVRRAA